MKQTARKKQTAMKQTAKSDRLYDAIVRTINRNKKGMTSYQILGTLASVLLRFWERNT